MSEQEKSGMKPKAKMALGIFGLMLIPFFIHDELDKPDDPDALRTQFIETDIRQQISEQIEIYNLSESLADSVMARHQDNMNSMSRTEIAHKLQIDFDEARTYAQDRLDDEMNTRWSEIFANLFFMLGAGAYLKTGYDEYKANRRQSPSP